MDRAAQMAVVALAVASVGATFARGDEGRQIMDFDKDWKFMAGDAGKAEAVDFADAAWRTLNLPHDYAIEGPAEAKAGQEGPFDPKSPAGAGGGYLDAGAAWHRKTFTVPAAAKGQRVAVQFDGVYMNSEVYLNGKLLGKHPYGYTPFEYDLTAGLNFDGPNTMAVHTNVEQPSSRWYSGAGIYRDVRLVFLNPVHIATDGMYITASEIADGAATLNIQATLENDAGSEAKPEVLIKVIKPDGTQVATAGSEGLSIPANGKVTFSPHIRTSTAQLWSIDEPNLYTVICEVSLDGKIVDSVTTSTGIRTIEFTKDNGFLLNGKRVQIRGVCDHHDLGALGSAFNERALQRQLQMLKAMGCNAIRTSHNPPDVAMLKMADEMGFVVMDEAFDEWKKSKTKYGYGQFFDDWSEKDLVTLIHRDRNHPSVVLWSIGNEISEQSAKNGGEMAKRLSDIAHREDPSRPTVSACNNPDAAVKSGFAGALDVFGINYHIAEYDVQKGKVLVASETASALSTRGEYGLSLDVKGNVQVAREIKETSQCTSYDLDKPRWGNTAEESLIALRDHPWMAGEFVWTGFDYIGEPTPYKWPSRSSYFGIIDLAGFPKDRFYLYQSQWTTKPMVHLLPHWNWAGFERKAIPVWAYTNADSVELFLNGKSLGSHEFAANSAGAKAMHMEWQVPYEPGTLKAVATKGGQTVATDEVVTAGAPATLALIPDRGTIRGDGKDLSFVTVRVLDAKGHVCPNADTEVSFSVQGGATIAGLDNGDPTNHEAFQGRTHKVFHGLGLVILRSGEGTEKATLNATAEGLSAGAAEVMLTH